VLSSLIVSSNGCPPGPDSICVATRRISGWICGMNRSPGLLAFSILGISMVAVLSGSAPLRGVAAACLGVMIAMIGSDPQTGTLRWTMDSLYLWDGLRLTPLLLGIFALPELCDLLIGRTTISKVIDKASIDKGQWQGVKDCFQNWWLIVRCSWIGGGIGSIPGISASVVDWLAYGHALKTEKGAAQTFGKGDVRGVIASESSNNAKEGGALVPTGMLAVSRALLHVMARSEPEEVGHFVAAAGRDQECCSSSSPSRDDVAPGLPPQSGMSEASRAARNAPTSGSRCIASRQIVICAAALMHASRIFDSAAAARCSARWRRPLSEHAATATSAIISSRRISILWPYEMETVRIITA